MCAVCMLHRAATAASQRSANKAKSEKPAFWSWNCAKEKSASSTWPWSTTAKVKKIGAAPTQLPTSLCRAVFADTVINPCLSVCKNEYTALCFALPRRDVQQPVTAAVYRTVFYFARLKPRLLFVIGGLLRALQQCTVFQFVLEPSVGVGAGINLLCLFAGSRWPANVVLGWAISKPFWRALRAEPPPGIAHVPINVVGVGFKRPR